MEKTADEKHNSEREARERAQDKTLADSFPTSDPPSTIPNPAPKSPGTTIDEEKVMAKCDICGNDYDKTFQITQQGRTLTFDSFECAIHAMAPTCAHCACRILGHGVEEGGKVYCCAHCAKQQGAGAVRDRA